MRVTDVRSDDRVEWQFLALCEIDSVLLTLDRELSSYGILSLFDMWIDVIYRKNLARTRGREIAI